MRGIKEVTVVGALLTGLVLPLAQSEVSSASATVRSQAVVYLDPAGDAGDAPDITAILIVPASGGTLDIDVKLAEPTDLGPYGWILLGLDTDRNQTTGDIRGNEFLLFANGDRVILLRWNGQHFVTFPHRPLHSRETATDVAFTLTTEDLGSRTFDFSAASLRQDADLAPAEGVFTYAPGRGSHAIRLQRR